ncbi:MAG: prepilin-type N-terminal cleavage/methylation domain-containing protein [Planctomycetota bacterium]
MDAKRGPNTARKSWHRQPAFSLVEVLTALAILALASSSVLVVIDRCVASAMNSTQRMRAFEVARENMEKLLASASVQEGVDYGESEKYPEIAWETVIETFYEPITSRMWIRGVCSAKYNDMEGQEQTVELTHWLTDLSKEQLLKIMERDKEEGAEDLTGQLFESMEEAAEYAGVDVETIQKWLENGMLTTQDGSFIKDNLDLYMRTNGEPSAEEKNSQIKSESELRNKGSKTGEGAGAGQTGRQDEIDPKTGLTYGELEQMDFSEIWDLMQSRRR